MLHYFPLEPLEQRYTTHLHNDILTYLINNKIQFVLYAPPSGSNKIETGAFLDANKTIEYKSKQIQMFAEYMREGKIKDGDVLFFSDLQFPGIEAIPYMCFFNNIKVSIRGIYHAGSFTDTDYVRRMERWMKHFEEIVFDISDKIFVGSHFMKKELTERRIIDNNKVVVTGLPLDSNLINYFDKAHHKENIVVFNGRLDDEKQPNLFDSLEKHVAMYTPDKIKFVNTGKEKLNKLAYYDLLAKAKVVVSFALQENFGYGIREAVYLRCSPVLPNRLVYPEVFDKQYLYDTYDECVEYVADSVINYNELEDISQDKYSIIKENEIIFKTWFGS